jgi:type IV pilus assembly protein PilC
MKFRVTVRNDDGKEETGAMEAPNRFSIYDQVEKNGGTVLKIEEGGGSFAMPAWSQITIGSGVKMEERITFTKNLAAMLSAGLTLSRALSVIERQTTNKVLKRITVEISQSVKEGSPFHESLAARPKIFSRLFVAMVKSGEESGTLADALKVVALQMERANNLTKKIKGAMIYPSIILFAIIVIGILMLIYVVPTLASTFQSLGTKLPTSTRVILGASNFMVAHYVVVIGGLVLFAAAMYSFGHSRVGSKIGLSISLYLPVIKTLVRETYSARATRSLSSLLSSGVEMLSAIAISREVVGNPVFGAVLAEAETRVRKGESLSSAFAAFPKLYPAFVADMIAVGEETGKVADMLGQVATYYEADVEEQTKDLSTIIEPVLMLVIGGAVGIFAVAMIAPIYSLSSSI